jgi:hypothetical protein
MHADAWLGGLFVACLSVWMLSDLVAAVDEQIQSGHHLEEDDDE